MKSEAHKTHPNQMTKDKINESFGFIFWLPALEVYFFLMPPLKG